MKMYCQIIIWKFILPLFHFLKILYLIGVDMQMEQD